MAFEEAIRSITLTSDNTLASKTGVSNAPGSAADNAGNQYRFVTIKGEHLAGRSDASTFVIGVLQNKPQVPNEAATVAIRGVTKVRASAAIPAGSGFKSTADGRAVAVAATDATSCGVAITSATEADELFSGLLRLGS